MSFKREIRSASTKIAVRQAKREHQEVMSTRYYRTLVKRQGRCSACGKQLRVGDEMVYRHNGQVTLCIPHADEDPLVVYRTSAKWDQWRDRERKKARRRTAA